MKKEDFDAIKRELRHIGLIFLLSLIIFKIAFFKENIVVLLRNVVSLFWLFVLPGYFIMLYWKEQLGFAERFVISIMLSAAVIGMASYYLGLIGLDLRFHSIILPPILMLVGIIIFLKRKEHQKN